MRRQVGIFYFWFGLFKSIPPIKKLVAAVSSQYKLLPDMSVILIAEVKHLQVSEESEYKIIQLQLDH